MIGVVFTSASDKGDLHVTSAHSMNINNISSLLISLSIDMAFSKMINGTAYFDDITILMIKAVLISRVFLSIK